MDKQSKILYLWAKTQLWYRQPLGYKAEKQLKELIGTDAACVLGRLTGFLQGSRRFTRRQKKLIEQWANIHVPE
jgi:hypothetical protein